MRTDTLRSRIRRSFAANRSDYALAPRAVRVTVGVLTALMVFWGIVLIILLVDLATPIPPDARDGTAAGIDSVFAYFTLCYWLAQAHREGRRVVYWLTFAAAIVGAFWMCPIGVPMLVALTKPPVRKWYSSEPL